MSGDLNQQQFQTLHRGVAEYGEHTSADAALDDMQSERGGRIGGWWGDEKTAQFYGDASGRDKPLGAYFTAKVAQHQIHDSPNASGVRVSGPIDVVGMHVKSAEGWKPLPMKPRRMNTIEQAP